MKEKVFKVGGWLTSQPRMFGTREAAEKYAEILSKTDERQYVYIETHELFDTGEFVRTGTEKPYQKSEAAA